MFILAKYSYEFKRRIVEEYLEGVGSYKYLAKNIRLKVIVPYENGLTYPIEASKAQIVASVEVIVATLVGVLYFKESLNYVSLIGIAIMLASIVLMNMQPSSSKPAL